MAEARQSDGRVAVLLATRDGARFLTEQMASLAAQDWPAIDIIASDDGSSDATLAVLAEWARRWSKGQFSVTDGPRQGFAENFRSLLANPEVDADYVAFSDQDDVWETDKLRLAIAALAPFGARPALFCSRTLIVDEAGNATGASPAFSRPPGFRNALVQSLAGGNTMVLNRAAHRLMREAARRTGFVSHDWFCYLVVSGAGGEVVFSQQPMVRYRQHGSNLVGSNAGWRARAERLLAALGGRFTRWNDANLSTLDACRDLLAPEARELTDRFAALRQAPWWRRLGLLRALGLYRQTRGGQLSLRVAALLGKL